MYAFLALSLNRKYTPTSVSFKETSAVLSILSKSFQVFKSTDTKVPHECFHESMCKIIPYFCGVIEDSVNYKTSRNEISASRHYLY